MSTLRLRCNIANVPLTLFPNRATSALLGVWLPGRDINMLLRDTLREIFLRAFFQLQKRGQGSRHSLAPSCWRYSVDCVYTRDRSAILG